MFGESNQYGRHSNIFVSILKEYMEELKYFEVSEVDIGEHYLIKVVSIMVDVGCTIYLYIVSICVRYC